MDNEERLVTAHEDLTLAPDFETSTAGARLLGRDLKMNVSEGTKMTLEDILARELDAGQKSRLALHMLQSEHGRTYENVQPLLAHLLMGLEDER